MINTYISVNICRKTFCSEPHHLTQTFRWSLRWWDYLIKKTHPIIFKDVSFSFIIQLIGKMCMCLLNKLQAFFAKKMPFRNPCQIQKHNYYSIYCLFYYYTSLAI